MLFHLLFLSDSSIEARLRDLGFGYRARFIQQSAKQILDNHGPQWLEGLRSIPYLEARDALRTLPGVGTKVQQIFLGGEKAKKNVMLTANIQSRLCVIF